MGFYLFDSSYPWQIWFHESATPIMEGIVNLHHDLMFFITFILFFVFVAMGRVLYWFSIDNNPLTTQGAKNLIFRNEPITHGTTIEVIWTVIPALILVVVALPSFALLYSIDEVIDPSLTIKCVGHQWYWSYEYSDSANENGSLNFDSYMIPEDELELGELRLLEVDNRVVLPTGTHIRVLITALDVLHSWAVPSLGIKVDSCPGRLNETSLFILREGVFYGQCSEICGVGHANMPIVVEAVKVQSYIDWLIEKI